MSSLQDRETVLPSTETGGKVPYSREEFLPHQLFGRVARIIWPHKTAFTLAALAGATDRAAKDWLSGKFAPPACVIAAMFVEVTKRN